MTQGEGHSSILTVPLYPEVLPSPRLVVRLLNMTITDIAVDWMNEDVYFIDSTPSSIGVWNANTNVTREVADSLENPRKLIYSFSRR